MNLGLLDQKGFGDLLLERVESGEWWVIVPSRLDETDFITEIEERFYDGEAGKDFEVVLPFSVALARKRRLSPEQLAGFMAEHEIPDFLTESVRGGQSDILFISSGKIEDIATSMQISQYVMHILVDARKRRVRRQAAKN